jgi:hypothetical protein
VIAPSAQRDPPIHANSAPEALSRIEDLVGEAQRIPHRAIAQAINLVVSVRQRGGEGGQSAASLAAMATLILLASPRGGHRASLEGPPRARAA